MSKMLSRELGRVRQDYHKGKNIDEPLGLCVEMAVSLESELRLHRLGDVDRLALQIVEGEMEDIMASDDGNVVEVDFRSDKERCDGRGI